MLYTEDWGKVCERFSAWWENDLDRPLIQVTAARKGHSFTPWWNWGFAKEPDSPKKIIDQFEEWCAKVFFGGDAYPDLWINLGPGILATYIGAEARFRPDSETVWFETPKDWDELKDLRFDPANKWWQRTKNITSISSQRSEGRFMAGITDLGGILDIAASLRGSQTLIVDLLRYPQDVKSLCSKILEVWHTCYEELYSILRGNSRGNSAWMGLWAPRRWYPIQCDFSAMLSPRLFREFALPLIREQCERLDYTIYHLDGPGEIPHLDSLLKIPELSGIQWVPGAGNSPVESSEWFHLYRIIQESGKLLVLQGIPRERAIPLLTKLKPRDLLISTHCLTEEDARNLLKEAKAST